MGYEGVSEPSPVALRLVHNELCKLQNERCAKEECRPLSLEARGYTEECKRRIRPIKNQFFPAMTENAFDRFVKEQCERLCERPPLGMPIRCGCGCLILSGVLLALFATISVVVLLGVATESGAPPPAYPYPPL